MPELCCLEPSSLNRPHPPHSWAHRDFAAKRLIRDVFAVRERRGDPRVVPSFRCTFLPDMPPSTTTGSPYIVSSKFTMSTWSSPHPNRLDTPKSPAIRSTRELNFRGFTGLQLLRPVRSLASPRRIRLGHDPATGGFYVQAFDGAVTLPAAGYDYDIDWTPMSAGLPPAGMAASFAARSHRTCGFTALRSSAVDSQHCFRCYLFKFRCHGQLNFSLNRRPCLPLNGAHVAQEQFNYR